jgi:hypothetical protein
MLKQNGWLGVALITGFILGLLANTSLLNGRPAIAQESRPQQILEGDRLRVKTIELMHADGIQRIQFVMDKDGSLNIHLLNAAKESKLLGQLQFRADDPPTLQVLDKAGKITWKDH